LPKLVKKNAKLKGVEINIKMIAFPNYAIEYQWNERQVQKLISSKNYDFAIFSKVLPHKMMVEKYLLNKERNTANFVN
jgi:hypothetical protein